MPAQTEPGRHVLLLCATTAYQTDDFVEAARRRRVEVTLGTDRCRVLARTWTGGALALEFRDPERAAEQVVEAAARTPFRAVLATDETTAQIAARAAKRLGLAHNPPSAADVAGDKLEFRRAMTGAGLPQPAFSEIRLPDGPLPPLRYPVVVKPRTLSASRGVMRADSEPELRSRMQRLHALLSDPEIRSDRAVVEEFVPGGEVAFEGLLAAGQLRTLAIFDKPDPLDGPFFPETIYVTPPMRSGSEQRAVVSAVQKAAAAIGLREGPVHAEVRLSPAGPVVLEMAARTIGGLCGRALTFGAGMSLEEIVLAWAVGDEVSADREPRASGVLMLPVPEAGVLQSIEGVEQAARVPGVEEVVITSRAGELVAPLPEGHVYLGFAFARGESPGLVVAALRRVRRELTISIKPRIGPMS